MQDPAFPADYARHRARIDAIDELMRALDEARKSQGITKATLARQINAEPAAIRRLFSRPGPNPQITRVVEMANALGLDIVAVPRKATAKRRSDKPAARPRLR